MSKTRKSIFVVTPELGVGVRLEICGTFSVKAVVERFDQDQYDQAIEKALDLAHEHGTFAFLNKPIRGEMILEIL